MRILIIGGSGMLGHQCLLSLASKHTVKVTLRGSQEAAAAYGLFSPENSYPNVDITHLESLRRVFQDFQPEAVINAVGIVKQLVLASQSIPSIEINALFPHRLAALCKDIGARLITMSTDCIFSGKQGQYTEDDFPDAYDLYGRTKYLGEVAEEHCVTIRSSIIGLELARKEALIEWFLAQRGTIRGFTQAIYTGLTTAEMARVIERILTQHTTLSGVWQITSQSINKFDLLTQLKEKLDREDIEITKDDTFVCDRSLSGEKFHQTTGYVAPSWGQMLTDLAQQIKQRERIPA